MSENRKGVICYEQEIKSVLRYICYKLSAAG